MHETDKEAIIKRYTERFKEFGVDVRALASGNRERQLMRFKIMSEVGDLNGAHVLDVGCGFGDYYAYLLDQGLSLDYTGIDICPAFIEVCQERFPEARFAVVDIQKDNLNGRFDYVFVSQVFNNELRHDDNEAVIRDVIKRAFALSDVAVVIDMLTDYVDFRAPNIHYYSPEKIFAFCKTITKRVALRHDYPLFEFMVWLYKDFEGWG